MRETQLVTKDHTGESLEERLTENAKNRIIPARYLRKDENGQPIETYDELFERVGKNIAVAEAVYTSEYVTITQDEIKPDHPSRDELIEEVFEVDTNGTVVSNETELTEDNAKWVSYDEILSRCEDEGWDETYDELQSRSAEFTQAMEQLSFMPNSPTLMNAGDDLQQLSACFVDSPEDDMKDIHDTASEAAQVFQSGGGMGYAFWRLRPYGDPVGSTGGIASGPITFMETYDQMCETIAQGGARRGAQMAVMRISHPDAIEFIHSKNKDVSLAHSLRLNDPDDFTHTTFSEALEEARELLDEYGTDEQGDQQVPEFLRNAVEGHLSNFNISVGVTDEFMEALDEGTNYTFKNPRTGEPHIATPKTKELYETYDLGGHVEVGEPLSVPAHEVWQKIIGGAHENGEPGVVFIDRINEEHSFDVESTPSAEAGEYEVLATNPCGEQPLMEYEACNLGHINLSTLVDENADCRDWREWNGSIEDFADEAIDWFELDDRVHTGVRFLDNVVTMSAFPIEEIEESVKNNRKIGLGIMGLAQLFIQLGVKYGSDEGNELARYVMKTINVKSKTASGRLAHQRGVFGNWEDSKWASPTEYPEWIEKQTGMDPDMSEGGFAVRNHNTTTIAPTGTTSMLGNTSAGCEPIHSVAFFKNVSQDIQGEEKLVEFDDLFLRTLELNDIDVESVKSEAVRQMNNNEFDGVDSLPSVPDELGELFVTTSDLDGIQHAEVQCALQKGVDSAISKTVNAPNEATLADTDEAFRHVYENGGKGVTYYRDGTRSKQVVTTRDQNQQFAENVDEDQLLDAVEERKDAGEFVDDLMDRLEVETAGESDRENVKPRPRPQVTSGETHRIETGYGTMYVTINRDENGLHEVFATVGKSGGFTESMVEAVARQASLALRVGADVEEVIDQMDDIRSPYTGFDNGEQIQSIPDGIATALKRYLNGRPAEPKTDEVELTADVEETIEMSDGGVEAVIEAGENPECPECGQLSIEFKEGCKTCSDCGWSRC